MTLRVPEPPVGQSPMSEKGSAVGRSAAQRSFVHPVAPSPLTASAGKGKLVRPSDVYQRDDESPDRRRLSLHFGGGKVDGETVDDETYEGQVRSKMLEGHLGGTSWNRRRGNNGDQRVLSKITKNREQEVLQYALKQGIDVWHAEEELVEALVMEPE